MTALRMLISRVRAVIGIRQHEEDLGAEVRAHLDHLEHEHRERGLSREEARAVALRDFGGVQQVKEAYRDELGLPWLDDLERDLRHAARALVKTPAFTAAAVATLALGIGANTTVFSVVNTILLRPLPYKDSDRLVHIIENIPAAESMSGAEERTGTMDPDLYMEWRTRTRTLSHIALRRSLSMTLSVRGEAVRLNGSQVSSPLFPMLQVVPRLGRVFETHEEKPGSDRVVMLSYGAWLTHFGSDPTVLGRSVSLDGMGYTVVGVMPQGFAFPDASTDFWTPLALTLQSGQFLRLEVIARVKEGVSLEAAAKEADTFSVELLGAPPLDQSAAGSRRPRIEIVSWKNELVAPVRPSLLVFAAAVTLVLLIACVNVANLFLARAITRQSEIAIRMTLGAGRRRILRQLLTESLMLALFGGVAGCALALAGIRILSALGHGLARLDLARLDAVGNTIPRLDEVGLDAPALLYTLSITVVTGVLFGLSPIRRLGRTDVVHAVGAHCGSPPLRTTPRSAQALLVVGQVALTMVLLLGAGLFIRSFVKLTNVDLGYDPSNLLTFQIMQPQLPWPPIDIGAQARQTALAEELVARLRSLPGVDFVAFTNALPMVQMRVLLSLSSARGAGAAPIPNGNVLTVSRDYVRAMGIRLIAGRGFEQSDRSGPTPSFLINETLARRYFGDADPVGKIVYLEGQSAGEVIGIVSDVRQSSLNAEQEPQLFIDPQHTRGNIPVERGGLYFVVRTDGDAAAIVPTIRSVVHRIDPGLPLHNVATMDQIVANSVSTPRSYAVLLGLFALVALALASMGLYGVLAYFVGQRAQEIGVRMALGAQRRDVLLLVVRQGLAVTGAGIILGLTGGVVLTRYLEKMLFGLTPLDLITFAATPMLFTVVAALACWIPARRATKVDALVALRYE